ncbi:DUF3830 family protein [Geochorda subterranea]|uniref:DUF3830 family protein n=1 Tax=Geochorda subterranea TaxID=3109564 RepID=A0ABZ1BRP1_9FIRM|nr:DUF3830 family protein [Limnochorda sp. LNt]WRP15243.1 DUF3830 family protein [Limnochorda sp. LNt]
MGDYIKLIFERGGEFKARVLRDRAPTNSQMVLDLLPFEGEVCHGMFSGEMCFCKYEKLHVVKENPKVLGVPAGALGLEYVPEGTTGFMPGILIAYGPKVRFGTPFTPDGEPFYVFGQIEGDLNALYRVGRRIHEQGVEKIRFERV